MCNSTTRLVELHAVFHTLLGPSGKIAFFLVNFYIRVAGLAPWNDDFSVYARESRPRGQTGWEKTTVVHSRTNWLVENDGGALADKLAGRKRRWCPRGQTGWEKTTVMVPKPF
jgi:hypothetical protein